MIDSSIAALDLGLVHDSHAVMRDSNPNQLVIGDARDALQAWLASGRRARLALLDPPYNTTSNFHHYRDSQPRDRWLAEREEHLTLVRDLLTPNGSMWLHLDDSELHPCKLMLDRVYGRDNYVGTVVWQKSLSRENRTALSTAHEYLLVYAKNRVTWARERNLLPYSDAQIARYRNPDDDHRGPWTSGDLTAKAGPGRRAAQFYDLRAPNGRLLRPAPGMAWRFTKERLDELMADGRVWFGAGGNNMPRLKRFLAETQRGLVPTTWWPGDEVGTTDSAKKQLRKLFPHLVPFETPKPEELVARVLQIATNAGDTVLDCYAGSGTTAAVALKMGRAFLVAERETETVNLFLRPRIIATIAGESGGVSDKLGWTGSGSFVEQYL